MIKFLKSLRLVVNRLKRFSPFFSLLRPSSLVDNININKATFNNATNNNRYRQLIFRYKALLTKIGAIKEPERAPISNLIIASLCCYLT